MKSSDVWRNTAPFFQSNLLAKLGLIFQIALGPSEIQFPNEIVAPSQEMSFRLLSELALVTAVSPFFTSRCNSSC